MWIPITVQQRDSPSLSLAITEWTDAMAPFLVKHLNGTNGRDVTQFLRNKIPQPYTEDDARFFIGLTSSKGLFTSHAIVLLDADNKLVEAIGSIGLTFSDPNDFEAHTAEFGYWLAKDWWSKGIMGAVVCEYLDKVAKPLSVTPRDEKSPKLAKIVAYAISDNGGSCKVLEKNGFILEGSLRRYAFKRGKWWDGKLYAYFL
ncbi:hypothetical protein HDU77_005146 [Chytriomyces hyalinus]|nr:hypothetical protein HDU77_005146 [Chytriomyces hyalinus]